MSKAKGSAELPLIVDCHSDVMIDVYPRRVAGERAVIDRLHRHRFEAGGVGGVAVTVGGDVETLSPLGLERATDGVAVMVEALRQDVAESEGRVVVASSADGMEAAVAGGAALALLPSLEGGIAFGTDPGTVSSFYDLGVRMGGIAWNVKSALATGTGAGEGGLTPIGAEVIREMNRLGMMVDVSHLSDQSFWGVVEVSTAPIMASHSNARTLTAHERNLSDAQLDEIDRMDGLVAIVLFPAFVGPHPTTLDHVLDHVAYIAGRIGVERVAIGSDFIDFARDAMEDEMRAHPDLYKEEDFVFPQGVENTTTLSRILSGLVERGFTHDDVRAVAHENFLRHFRAVERASAITPREDGVEANAPDASGSW